MSTHTNCWPTQLGAWQHNRGWLGVTVGDGHMKVGSPSVIHDADVPQLVLGVMPPSDDDCTVEHDFAASAMEKHIAPSVDQGGDREEIVHKAQ